MTTTTVTSRPSPPTATLRDTLGFVAGVAVPTVARGVISRPPIVALAERLDLDRRAVRWMQRLRDRYGPGPLLLRLPVRSQAVVLAPGNVQRVLDDSPDPFATDSGEKRATLSHSQPQGVLISHGRDRSDRRRFD